LTLSLALIALFSRKCHGKRKVAGVKPGNDDFRQKAVNFKKLERKGKI
jgi:hypothetical protein